MAHTYIFDEQFETAVTGYEETWTATNQGTGGSESAVQTTPAAGSPSGWFAQCLRLTYVAATTRYILYTRAATAATSISFDMVVGSSSLASGQTNTLALAIDGSSNPLWALIILNFSGVFYYQVYLAAGGTLATFGSATPWPIGTRKRFNFIWDDTTHIAACVVDGRFVSPPISMSGAAVGRDFASMVFGTSSAATTAQVNYFDRIVIDTVELSGYNGDPLVGPGGGYIGQGRLVGLGTLLG